MSIFAKLFGESPGQVLDRWVKAIEPGPQYLIHPNRLPMNAEIGEMTADRRALIAVELARRLAPILASGRNHPVYGMLAWALTGSHLRFDATGIAEIMKFHASGPFRQVIFDDSQLLSLLKAHRGILWNEAYEKHIRQLKVAIGLAMKEWANPPRSFYDNVIAIEQILHPDTFQVVQSWQRPIGDRYPQIEDLSKHSELKSSDPGAKWKNTAKSLVEAYGQVAFADLLNEILSLLSKQQEPVPAVISDRLRGIISMGFCSSDPRMPGLLRDAITICAHKIPGVGARSKKGFSAAVWALSNVGTEEALAILSQAKAKIRTPSLADELVSSLRLAATRQGTTVEELEELVVPTFGLADGKIEYEMGEDSATVEVTALSQVNITWKSGDKIVKSPSKRMTGDFGDDVKEIKALKKSIETAISAQRQRFESLFLSQRQIQFAVWKERYWDQPLLQSLTTRLIWSFEEEGTKRAGMPRGNEILDSDGQALTNLDNSTVQIWHPLTLSLEEVTRWRNFLFQFEVMQPFKQAFREVYVVTPAEEATETYSNRFAAQVLRQHQMAALARERGWRYSLMGGYDMQAYPTLVLRDWDLSVEFYIEAILDEINDAGVSTYVSTDQVRFMRRGNRLPLTSIPPIAFSEIMRDVDLFVGVTSIGNDAAWMDQGERPLNQAWQGFAFGDLNGMADTRKEVLMRLLPRLKIASVAELSGNYLEVKGKLHNYKIHLGTSNIMADGKYLCIVPGRDSDKDSTKYLPFEGDRTLSIILSKALLLAEDDKITDRTILRQL